ncbi:penicillin acylase family protein [Chitinophaga lutea]|uniref:Penicillin acylase family protein n=1 Tax=Chitinophaga lutea TaxID=2488634 RepID=A0A3N4PXZ6_9BACT|nr:penicillin acylase family protein [Chitinophaga lutea]RPE08947.1 penicillin acylase family protein [Chitinophaga lutea]
MRLIPLIVTIALVWALNHKWGSLPAFGMLLSPQHGFWQHAESLAITPEEELLVPGLQGEAQVWFDERMVAHVFAAQERDAYFIQGYLHAKNRLWQMELQTYAAGGRLCEILGANLLQYDRRKRREGMVFAAERAVAAIEADPVSKMQSDAYTAGVNAYIQTLRPRNYPLEYKLLGYSPEPWTNLKTALLIKYMSYDLASTTDDLEYTNARQLYGKEDFDLMYPDFPAQQAPIIPAGTAFPAATKHAVPPADSLLGEFYKLQSPVSDRDKGSNNWVVAGSKTRSGAPILCNDPHLELGLPSLFYEMQIKTPEMNVYGVSLPGAPGIIIGFNDHIGWGLTNGYMDVLDFYRMQFRNGKKEYLFNGEYRPAQLRLEEIKIRGDKPFIDTVAYTEWGPVMYDNTFPDLRSRERFLAMRWTAHDPSNELLAIYRLNHARNYDGYKSAMALWNCPAQNFVYAGKDSGDIAIWHNGRHPLRWKDQGKFVMPGSDSTYAWQGFIPQAENPHSYNPPEGFVSSANQAATDSTYPYHMFGYYDLFRGMRIKEQLSGMQGITPEDMMRLQKDNKNRLAEAALPFLGEFVNASSLTAAQRAYWKTMFAWDAVSAPDSKGATLFLLWWSALEQEIWNDDLVRDSIALRFPDEKTTLFWLMRDTAMHFVDNIRTPQHETLSDAVVTAFQRAADSAAVLDAAGKLTLGKFRGTDIRHLSRSLPALSRMGLNTGGGKHIVNATKKTTGPSWRMIVELGKETKAWGIYPGGQSGNPGSRFYDNMVDDWVDGKYYSLRLYDDKQTSSGIVKKIFFKPGT